MAKVMLVLESQEDLLFLEKLLTALGLEVILMQKGKDVSEQLIDHFPDIVFASTLGRNERILSTLAQIKKMRGKPKLVYIRADRDGAPLNPDQKKIIDGVLGTPIDPMRLLEAVASTTPLNLEDLKARYQKLRHPKDEKLDQIKRSSPQAAESPDTSQSQLVSDPSRRAHYLKVVGQLNPDNHKKKLNADELRRRQIQLMAEVKEDPGLEKNRKHFIKTLFGMKAPLKK